MQKAQADIRASQQSLPNGTDDQVIHEDGSVTMRDSVRDSTSTAVEADDDASIKGIVSPSSEGASKLATQSNLNLNDIPTIKVSTESDRELEHEQLQAGSAVNGNSKPVEEEIKAAPGLERPVQAASGDNGENADDSSKSPAQDGFSFSNKRLCERWLDNLFMVLYEVRPALFLDSD